MRIIVFQSVLIRCYNFSYVEECYVAHNGYAKNPLSITPFWEKASAEPPLEWSDWAAILEMAVLTKDEIEVRKKLQAKAPSVEPSELIHELEISIEGEAQKKSRCTKSKQKRSYWGNRFQKAREKGVLWNSFPWDEADEKVRSYLFLCLCAKGQCQVQQKRPSLNLHDTTTTTLEDIVITKIKAFGRCNFIWSKQMKKEKLEQFHADFKELASRANCGDAEDEFFHDMFRAHMNKETIAETRSPQDAYE